MIPELQKLAELEAKATAAPWWSERDATGDDWLTRKCLLLKYKAKDVPTWLAEHSEHPNEECNMAFIAATRNALPALLALASAAVEECNRCRESITAGSPLWERLLPYRASTDSALAALREGRGG